jgi:ribonucleoside-diphosphate reductase alpha chain
MASSNRKIGLGVMGWADMLASLKIRYDSDQAIELAEQIIKTIQEEAIASSQALAVERGPFPNFDKSIYAGEKPIRNAARTTIAPTGTISIIAGASAGIEPFFGNTYWHRDGEGNVRRFTNEVLRKDLEARAINADAVFEKLFKGARLDELKEIPEDIARTYVTSHELSVEKQIAMQAAFQKHIDNAASKTLNLVYEAPLETVDKAYRASFLAGNKGVTVYRNGCKDNQPIQFGRIEERQPAAPKKTLRGTIDKPIVVPEIMPAVRIRQDTPFGHVHATVVFDSAQEYMPVETFGLLGNAGSEEAAELEALGRSASLYLRSGGSLETVVDQYIGIGSGVEKSTRSGTVKSIAMGVGKALLKFLVARKYFSMEELLLGKVDYEQFSGEVADLIRTKEVDELLKANGAVRVQDFLVKENATSSERNGKRKSAFNERCPHCKAPLMRQEGCLKCPTPDCGFSRC